MYDDQIRKAVWLWSCHLGQAVSAPARDLGDVSAATDDRLYNDVIWVNNAIMSKLMPLMTVACVNHVKVGRPVQYDLRAIDF